MPEATDHWLPAKSTLPDNLYLPHIPDPKTLTDLPEVRLVAETVHYQGLRSSKLLPVMRYSALVGLRWETETYFPTCQISIIMALITILILIAMTQFLTLSELHLKNVLIVSK